MRNPQTSVAHAKHQSSGAPVIRLPRGAAALNGALKGIPQSGRFLFVRLYLVNNALEETTSGRTLTGGHCTRLEAATVLIAQRVG